MKPRHLKKGALRSEMVAQLILQNSFRAMIMRAWRNPPRMNLQQYLRAMKEWMLRKLIRGSMQQKQQESREQHQICAIAPKIAP